MQCHIELFLGVRIDLVGNITAEDTARISHETNRNIYYTPPEGRTDPNQYPQRLNYNPYYHQNRLNTLNHKTPPKQKSSTYRQVDKKTVYPVYPSSSKLNLQGQSDVLKSKLSKAQDRISLDSLDTLINVSIFLNQNYLYDNVFLVF